MGAAELLGLFLTGLLVGGLSCLAVQGGLLAASIAQIEEKKIRSGIRLRRESGINQAGNALPILSFLIAKLIAYTFLGFLLGWFGSIFQFSLRANLILQFLVGIFMLGTALNLLGVHPIFRYFIIQPPRFLTRIIRKESKSGSMFAPAILGAFTVLIPCGATQAVMALSIASGNPFIGAAILFSFILGTSPVFFFLGYFAAKLGEVLKKKFIKFASFVIIILAIFNLNNALSLTGTHLTLNNFGNFFWCTVSYCDQTIPDPNNNAQVTIKSSGYYPNVLTVTKGSLVTIKLTNENGAGCTQAFTIPSLGIQKIVPLGKAEIITFQAPSEAQQLSFMCSMGMYRGVINVI